MDLAAKIRDVPDFPKPGIIFKDITPLLQDPAAFREAIDQLAAPFQSDQIDLVVAIESRGFIFGAPLAQRLGAGFVPVRKREKLPWQTVKAQYATEYSIDALEMHRDAIRPGQRALIVDDLLATGGTIEATIDLVRQLGGIVIGIAFLVELTFLHGRQRLKDGYKIVTLIQY